MVLLTNLRSWFINQTKSSELTYYEVMHFKAIGYKEMYQKYQLHEQNR